MTLFIKKNQPQNILFHTTQVNERLKKKPKFPPILLSKQNHEKAVSTRSLATNKKICHMKFLSKSFQGGSLLSRIKVCRKIRVLLLS